MQNVAWAITTVHRLSETPMMVVNMLFRAMPVTTPGSAIGRITRRLMTSRPKNSYRCNDSASSVPSTSEMTVATTATHREDRTASRTPGDSKALPHHSKVKPLGGQPNVRSALNEFTTTSISGV